MTFHSPTEVTPWPHSSQCKLCQCIHALPHSQRAVELSQAAVPSPGVCRSSCLCWLGKLLGGIGAAQHRGILNKDSTFKTQLQCTGNVYMWLLSACKHAMHLQCSIQTEQYIAYYTTRKNRRLNTYTHSILYVYQLTKAYTAKMSCIIELLLHESSSKATADPLHIQSNPNDVAPVMYT